MKRWISMAACAAAVACSGDDVPAGGDGGAGLEDAGPIGETKCAPARKLPDDPAERGPWAVGARTVQVGNLQAEVWYPAAEGSEEGEDKLIYDLREYLPGDQSTTVEESDTILQPCDCYAELPIDHGVGAFPVILFIHGTSGFKGQSLEQMTHWASRGFVVISGDHPSIGLKTFLSAFDGDLSVLGDLAGSFGGGGAAPAEECDPTGAVGQTGEGLQLLDALQEPSGDLAFLEGYVDMQRVGAAGHSAGGGAVANMGGYPGVKVVIPEASGGACDGEYQESVLVLGGQDDDIVAYTSQTDGYDTTPPTRRLVGIAGAGHMAFTSFCPIGEDEGGILSAAQNAGVNFNPLFLTFISPLASDGCEDTALDAETGWEIINYATAAAFEEVLYCLPKRAKALKEIADRYPDVGEYKQEIAK